ncbi:MAG TPA: hypothetical protein VMT23_02405, partial [Candidatus Binatia bacterium]|nr:hypothetical protein [Candidatus Binatia bacterium]
DAHNSTGTFDTTTGTNQLNGNTTVTGTKTFTVNGGLTTLGAGLTETGPASFTGSGTSSNAVNVSTGAASNTGLNIQGASAQTANLIQLQDSTGATTQYLDGIGNQEQLGYLDTPYGGVGSYSNFLSYSEGLNNWTATNITVTANDGASNPAPDGNTTADKLVSNTTSPHTLTQNVVSGTAATYNFSIWIKTNSGTQSVQLRIDSDGSPSTGTAATFTATTTWQRLSVKQAISGQSTITPTLVITTNSATVVGWGAQLVQASVPEVYVRTNASPIFSTGGVGGIVDNGTAIFSSAVSSSTAFQVQNSSSTQVLAVDTSGNQVVLGAPSSLTGKLVFNTSAGANNIAIVGPATNPTGNYTLTIPTITANANICTDNSICSGYASASSKLNKNATDTSTAAVTSSNNLYTFTNSSSAVASGVLYLDNGTNTNTNLTVTASGNPGAGQALILASNTNASPSGNLIDLQSGSSPSSKFRVDASGNVVATGTFNTNTFTSSQLIFGSGSTATIDSASGQALQIGTTNATAVTLGNTTNTATATLQTTTSGTLSLQGGSGGINIGTANASNTIQIGNIANAVTQTINIGTNATSSSVTHVAVGSTKGASDLTFNAGTGGTNISGEAVANTVNIGKTGSTAASGTANIDTSTGAAQTIAIGGSGGSSGSHASTTITLQAGSSEVDLASAGVTLKEYTNSTTAFQVQNASGTAFNVFTVDTSTNTGAGTGQIVLGSSNNATGTIAFKGNAGTGTLYLQGPTSPNSGNYTLSIPAITANDIICTNGTFANCTNYAPVSGDGSYILNQTSLQSSSNFHISGTGTADTSLLAPTLDRATAGTLSIGTNTTNTTGLTLGNTSMTSALAIQAGTGGLNLSTNGSTSNITIRNSVAGASSGSPVTIGLGDNALSNQVITIGNTNSGAGIKEYVGTNNYVLDGAGASTYTLGASTTTGSITIGGTAQTGNIDIGTGTGAEALNFGTGGTGAKTVIVGSTASSSALTLNAGSGQLTVQGGTGAIVLQNLGTGNINIANNTVDSVINIGKTGTTSNLTTVNLATSSGGGQTVNIGGTGGGGNSNAGTVVTVQGGASQLQIANGGSVFTGNVSQSGGTVALTANGASSFTTSSGALTLTSNQAATWSTTNGNLTIQAAGGTVSLGSSTQLTANAGLTVSSASGSNTLTLQGGNTTTIQTQGTGTINIATNNLATTTNIGTNTSSAQAVNIGGTGGGGNSNAGTVVTVQGGASQLQIANGGNVFTGNVSQSTGTVSLHANGASDFTTSSGALTITSNQAATWSTTNGNITLQAAGGTVTLGTSTQLTASGNLSVASGSSNTLTLSGGSTGILINANGAGNTGTIVKPTTDSTAAFAVQSSGGANYIVADTSGGNLYLGNTGLGTTVQIGTNTGAVTQNINIGINATGSSTTNVNVGSTVAGTTTLQSAGGVVVSSLQTADTATYLCRNSANKIATCSTNVTGSAFVQGGNSFGADAALGTNDGFNLTFKTNSTLRATFDQSNNLYLGNGITAGTPNNFTIADTGSSVAGTAGGTLTVSGGAGTATGTGSAGGGLTLQGGSAGAGSTARSGGLLTLQGGAAAGTGNANGANVILQGGAGVGTGVQGVNQFSSGVVFTTGAYSSGSTSTITQSLVDNNSAILATATTTGLTFTVPSPTITTAGRVLYVSNASSGSNAFTLNYGTGSFTLNTGSTATLFWNANSAWTSAGVDASALQNAYNNSAGGTTPEIKIDSTRNALDIQDSDTAGSNGILIVRASNGGGGGLGQALFTVGNTGAITLQNSANQTSAFQIQNSAGTQLINVDTTNPQNLVTNPSIEQSISGNWAGKGTGASVVQSGLQQYIGNYSLQVTKSTTASTGTSESITLAANTTYTLSMMVKASVTSISTIKMGFHDNADQDCLTAQTITPTSWTKLTCTFTTTGGTISSSLIYVVDSSTTANVFYVDAVQLTLFSLLPNPSVEQSISSSNWQTETGSPTVTQDATVFNGGTHSLKIVEASGGAAQGVKDVKTLNNSTAYYMTFWTYQTTSTFTTLSVGYSSTGVTGGEVDCLTGITAPSAAGTWTQYNCYFTTPASNSGNPYIYFKDTATTSGRTWYIDDVALTQGPALVGYLQGAPAADTNYTTGQQTIYQEGRIAINGVINSPVQIQNQSDSSSAFSVSDVTGNNVLNVNTLTQSVEITGVGASSGLRFTNLNSNSSGATTFTGILGLDTNGNVGLSQATVSLISPALAYWDGGSDPTTGSQAYPTPTVASRGTNAHTPTFVGGSGEQLTDTTTGSPPGQNETGTIDWSFSQVSFEETQFQFKAGGGTGADSTWFYSYANGIPTTEYGANWPTCAGTGNSNGCGYIIYFSEYHHCVGISWGSYQDGNQCGHTTSGTDPLAHSSPLWDIGDNAFHDVDIQLRYNIVTISWDGQVVLTYNDSFGRNLTNLDFGFGSRTGGSTNNHYIKGLLVTKLGSDPSKYHIDTVTPLANNLYMDTTSGAQKLGIGITSPTSVLDVAGSSVNGAVAGFSNLVYNTGTVSEGTGTGLPACGTTGAAGAAYTANTTVTGSGTNFTTGGVLAGDLITLPDGVTDTIASVGGTTTLTTNSSHIECSGSYTITRKILQVTGNNVTVGNGATGDAAGSLVILDSDTNATFSAGTASNAPTEIDGAMFYSKSNHSFLCGVAGSWETCNGLLYSNTSAPGAVNSCTTACGNIGAAPIPANYCQAGRVIHIMAKGVFGSNSTAPTMILGFYLGTSTTRTSDTSVGGVSPTFTPAVSLSAVPWSIDYTLLCFSTTSMSGAGTITYQNSTTNTTADIVLGMPATTTSSLATTAQTLYLFPQFGTSNSANTITGTQYIVTGN